MSTDDLRRLGDAVKTRRLELGLARLKAAQMAHISKDTWKRVEEALPVREMKYAKIDPILGWAVGSCAAIKAGGRPTPVTPSAAAPGVVIADAGVPERGVRARRIIESQSVAVTDLSAPKIRELSERIVEDLRREGIL